MLRRSLASVAVLPLAFASACDSDVSSAGGEGGAGGEIGPGAGGAGGSFVDPQIPPAPDIEWSACPADGAPDLMCADVPVPIDWQDWNQGSLGVHVRRLRSISTPARASLWLLEGGPGASGAGMIEFATRMRAAHPDLDVYVPDHRGTGATAPLVCDPNEDPPPAACLASLEDTYGMTLEQLTTSGSARDAATIARWTSTSGSNLLYGRSYGTYWAHRAVSLDPNAWQLVVLDSPCDPVSGCPAARRDAEVDIVGRRLLLMCNEDSACSAEVGGDAVALAESVVAAADRGTCAGAASAGLDGVTLRYALASLAGSARTRALVPAVMVRYDRCNADDVQALTVLTDYVAFLRTLPSPTDFSFPTNYQVNYSESWDPTFTVAQAQAQLDATVIASGASLRWAQFFPLWPWTIPAVDPRLRAWGTQSLPTLVLVGGLDFNTPPQLVAAGKSSLGADSHWVEFAYADHVPVADETDATGACSGALIDAFLTDPSAELDVGCVAQVEATSQGALFDVDPGAAQEFFGTTDAYGTP